MLHESPRIVSTPLERATPERGLATPRGNGGLPPGGLNSLVTDWPLHNPQSDRLGAARSGPQPEFWFVRNVDDEGEPTLGHYQPREEFQRRDRRNLAAGEIQIYRNGDIRAHVTAWEKIDEAFGSLLGTPDFRPIATPRGYADWVKFKMGTIAAFYEHYCSRRIIGSPIDAFAFSRTDFFNALLSA